jgi:ATP-dependent Clp protease ATP-binding subunit ClpX
MEVNTSPVLDSVPCIRKSLPVPTLTPAKIASKIRACGYVGQERAVKAVSLFAFRHLDRLRRIRRGLTDNLPKKTNLLLAGPTGCGKTHLIELLFSKILRLPTVVIDITTYSETGYVGQDLCTILTRLLFAANMKTEQAETGIVCLDEFDKIAMSDQRAMLGGNGESKDVTGFGVQRELLKMVEGTKVTVPLEIGSTQYGKHIEVSTNNIPFIACGAFSGLTHIARRECRSTIGYLQDHHAKKESIAASFTESDVNLVSTFQRFGFLPELIGRFSRIIPFEALGENELRNILKQNVMPSWKEEMALHQIDMVVDDSLVDFIVTNALQKETGARSVESVFAQLLEDAAFDAYSCIETTRVVLNLDQGRPGYRIEQY